MRIAASVMWGLGWSGSSSIARRRRGDSFFGFVVLFVDIAEHCPCVAMIWPESVAFSSSAWDSVKRPSCMYKTPRV